MSKKNSNCLEITKINIERGNRMRTRSIGLGSGLPEANKIPKPRQMDILRSSDFETIEVEQDHVPKEISGKTIMTEHITYTVTPTKKTVTKKKPVGRPRKTAQKKPPKKAMDKKQPPELNGVTEEPIQTLRVRLQSTSLSNRSSSPKRKRN